MNKDIPIWRRLFRHWVLFPAALALLNAGNNMAAKMAMMAMTTRSSISVNARARWYGIALFIMCFLVLAWRVFIDASTVVTFGRGIVHTTISPGPHCFGLARMLAPIVRRKNLFQEE